MKQKTNTLIKFLAIGSIIGLLLILNACIGGKLNERERTQKNAVNDISRAGGGPLTIKDIYIGIPFVYYNYKVNDKGIEEVVSHEEKTLFIQPRVVNYNTKLQTQMRKIGIYESPIYTGEVLIDGNFNFTVPKSTKEFKYKFNEAYLKIKINDKSLISSPVIEMNGAKYATEYSGIDDKTGIISYFNCTTGNIKFNTGLKIRGANDFQINLSSTESHLVLESDWISPGFSKYDYLPLTYEITDNGFTAEWNVPFDIGDTSHQIGFSYVQPINVYKMLERAVNYGFLFILVPFIVLFLFELFAAINLHPFHYLLSGAASIIFFLLLLSFSEHISFTAAYLISAIGSGVLVSLYVSSITRKYKLGFTMSFVFVVLYGYLFMSLKSEDYALLIGSMFAFIILAVVMFLTRKVDWNSLKKTKIEESC